MEPTGSPASEAVGAPETPGDQVEAPAGADRRRARSVRDTARAGRRVRLSVDAPTRHGIPGGRAASAGSAADDRARALGRGRASGDRHGGCSSGFGRARTAAGCRSASPARRRGWQRRPRPQPRHKPSIPMVSRQLPASTALGPSAGRGRAEGAAAGGNPRSPGTDAHRGRDRGRSHDGDRASRVAAAGDGRAAQAGQRAVGARGGCRARHCVRGRPGGRAGAGALRRRQPCGPRAAGPLAATGSCFTGSAASCATRTGQRAVRARQPGCACAVARAAVRLESPDELARAA